MRSGRKARGSSYRCVRQGTFEVRKGGTARFDFTDPYHLAVALPWPAFVAAALSGLLLLNLAFASLYALRPGALRDLAQGDVIHAFFFSLETLTTVGYGEIAPLSLYGYAVASVEMVVGMASVALLTGLLFVRFSRSRPGILFADHAVIAAQNGHVTLMIRLANDRSNMLTNATAKLSVLLKETDDGGYVSRRYHPLPLVCPHLPAFPLTWTLRHVIDETSPLHGYGPEELRDAWGRLFISIEALDAKVARQVQDLADYHHERILFGVRYADIVSYDENGMATADLSQLSLVEAPPRRSAKPIGHPAELV